MRYTEVGMPKVYRNVELTEFKDGILHQRLPRVTTDPRQLEEQAKSKLPLAAYNYVAGGAGERATMDANRLAFRQWKLVPRMLRQTTHRDLTIKLFGEAYGKKHREKRSVFHE